MATGNHTTQFPAAIIFDLDGTLIDSGVDIAHAANAAREVSGCRRCPWRRRSGTWAMA